MNESVHTVRAAVCLAFCLISGIPAIFSGCKRPPGDNKIVTWAMGNDPTGTHRELIRMFEERNPGIKIRYVEMPQNTGTQHDTYVTYLAARDPAIDVYSLDIIWPGEFASAGWVVPLDSYFPSEERELFLDGPIRGCTFEGSIYAVPWFTDAGLLYYRKDLLEKEGLSPPRDWDEFIRQAKFLSKKYDLYGFVFQGMQYEGLVCNFLEWVWGNGGDLIDARGEVVIDQPQAVEALEFMVDLLHKHRVTPEGVVTYKEEESLQVFQSGNSVFLRNWPYVWRLAQEKKGGSKVVGKIGVTAVPGKSGKSASTLGGWNLAISRFSKDPETAWKWVRFLTGAEAQKILALKSGRLPTRKKLYRDPDILDYAPHYRDFYSVFVNARPRPSGPNYPRITDTIQIAVHKALTKKASPENALILAAREIRKIIAKR